MARVNVLGMLWNWVTPNPLARDRGQYCEHQREKRRRSMAHDPHYAHAPRCLSRYVEGFTCFPPPPRAERSIKYDIYNRS